MHRILSSRRFRRVVIQALFVAVIALAIVSAVVVGQRNIAAQGMASGFGFLGRTTGWPVSFSVIELSSRSTYARVLLGGFLNTILIGFLALFFASLLGLLIALLRVSGNKLMRIVGTTYIEVFRNVPVILQVFFWYAIVTHLPSPREAMNLGDMVFLSNRGLMFPAPAFSAADWSMVAAGLVLLVIGLVMSRGRKHAGATAGAAALAFVLLVAWLLWAGRAPGEALVTLPQLKGLRFVGGITIKPEFSALLTGLVLFGAAYIGEIIRGGILSVDPGKLEAGAALGLSRYRINRHIRLPLALRAMLPALANQYVWLMKATTVGIAIGFPDYFAIVSSSINQTGQTLELLALLMGGFIVVNYSIGFAMNLLNRRLELKGKAQT